MGQRRESIGAQETIAPGYLHVMGIPLRAGRDVTNDDITQHHPVVIIDEQVARQLWNGDALGKRLALERARRSSSSRSSAWPARFAPGGCATPPPDDLRAVSRVRD